MVIAYILEENPVLKEQCSRRLQFTYGQRWRLAVKAKAVGQKLLNEVATLVTADPMLAWCRNLIAQIWTYTKRNPGLGIDHELIRLVVRFTKANPCYYLDAPVFL